MKKYVKLLSTFLAILVMAVNLNVSTAKAYSEVPGYFDFFDTVLSINAGSSQKVLVRAYYDYTYYVGPHTSTGTYAECTFKSGTEYIVLHIGADEQEKNVFFHFYVTDDKVPSGDVHDCIEVYVQKMSTASDSIAAPIANKKTGSLKKTGNVAMLYNESGVAMASFSLSNGTGNMQSIGLKGVVNNGQNYFDVVSGTSSYPAISESDKAVMIANGYAGVCVNGVYKNW
jgi:hypothetical protein